MATYRFEVFFIELSIKLVLAFRRQNEPSLCNPRYQEKWMSKLPELLDEDEEEEDDEEKDQG